LLISFCSLCLNIGECIQVTFREELSAEHRYLVLCFSIFTMKVVIGSRFLGLAALAGSLKGRAVMGEEVRSCLCVRA